MEDQFEPAVGFVNRRRGLDGFRRYNVRTRVRPRPKPNRMHVRYLSIGPELQVVTNRQDEVKFWRARASWWTQYNSERWTRFEVERTHDVIDEAFQPSSRENFEIPIGAYTFPPFWLVHDPVDPVSFVYTARFGPGPIIPGAGMRRFLKRPIAPLGGFH